MAAKAEDTREGVARAKYGAEQDLRDIAAELFLRHWRPVSDKTPEGLASMCFSGAAAFCRIAAKVKEGEIRGPEYVLPEPVPAIDPASVSTTAEV